MDYFYIQDGKIIGCGQARVIDNDVINAEVTPDMVNYSEDWTWESERFKWKYKWDGEKVIDNPDFETEETAHYNEAMRQARSEAYASQTDNLVARKIRKQTLGEWTEADEEEFVSQISSISENIKQTYPYKEI